MARTNNNLFLLGFSGKVDGLLIKKYEKNIVLSAIPDMSGRVLSGKQKQQNGLMISANVYAQYITSDPKLKEEARRVLKVPPNKVFRALVQEYLLRKGKVNDLIELSAEQAFFLETSLLHSQRA